VLQRQQFALEWDAFAISFVSAFGGLGAVTWPVLLMLLVRQKYPRWWFEWNLELFRFINRVIVYLALMTDRYPATDEQQAVDLDISYPADASLSRGLPLIKWLLAAPHYFLLVLLLLGLAVAVSAAWVSILVSGRYPRFLFSYVEGVLRWWNRVAGYAFTFVTDEYPPFRLAP